jgi:hypothetical protein
LAGIATINDLRGAFWGASNVVTCVLCSSTSAQDRARCHVQEREAAQLRLECAAGRCRIVGFSLVDLA